YRSGFSTSLNVSHAGITDAAATASPRVRDRLPQWAVANTIIGQCQRYREYERSPTHRNGGVPRIATGPRVPAAAPATITAAAPSVGSAAAYPGQGVRVVTTSPAAMMAARPAQ